MIYVHDDNLRNITTYEINDTKCTIDKLFNILNINRCWQIIMFNNEVLNSMDKDTMLSDIGLGPECTITISDKELTEDEERIIKGYSIEALEAYKVYMGMEEEDVEFNHFSDNYRGYFSSPYEFVNYCIESEEIYDNLPYYFKKCIDKEKDYLYEVYMNDFWEQDGYYFWIH